MLYISTNRVICFHDEFYCIGSDVESVRKGISNKNSYKRYYSDFGATKEDFIKENDETWLYPVVEPIK